MLDDPEQRSRETAEAGLIKGKTACNRSACQAPLNDKDGSRWWNTSTLAYYCKYCAAKINKMTGQPILITESVKCQQEHEALLHEAVMSVQPQRKMDFYIKF